MLLSNLGIQAGHVITVEDYHTRLLRPLLDLMNVQDQLYTSMKDIVVHAAKLWNSLHLDKIRQEVKEDRERRNKAFQQNQNPKPGHPSQRQNKPHNSQTGQGGNDKTKLPRPKLSKEKQQHHKENNLCFNCGYPDHSSCDCSFKFNANRVQPRLATVWSGPDSGLFWRSLKMLDRTVKKNFASVQSQKYWTGP